MSKNRHIKKRLLSFLIILSLLLVLGIAFIFIPENPYLSNYLKRLVLPEIQSATGYIVTADRIYLHVFPLYAGIKNLKIIDQSGATIGSVGSIKVYPEVSSFFLSKVIVIKRISIKEVSLAMDKERFGVLQENVKEYLDRPRGKRAIIVTSLDISKGEFLWSSGNSRFEFKGISLSGRLRNRIEIKTLVEKIYPGNLKNPLSLKTRFFFSERDKGKEIDIEDLTIFFRNSEVKLAGRFNTSHPSRLNLRLHLWMGDLTEFSGLRSASGDNGRIRAKGFVNINPLAHTESAGIVNFFSSIKQAIGMNLNITAEMRIENLFRLLNVSEPVYGRLGFEGELEGTPENPVLKGRTVLRDGEIFGVRVDELKTIVHYNDHRFVFTDGRAVLYGGSAIAEAEIPLPVHTFRLYIKASALRDKPVMGLVGLNLAIPDGFVDGELSHSGKRFSPSGWFHYRAHNPEPLDLKKSSGELFFLSSIKEIRGDFIYDGEDRSLILDGLRINSDLMVLRGGGTYRKKEGYLDGHYEISLNPSACEDLNSSVLKFKSGHIQGDLKGTLSGLSITGRIELLSPTIKGYELQEIKGVVHYTPPKLYISLRGTSQDEEHTLIGDIGFINSAGLFDLSHYKFSMKAHLKGLRFRSILGYRPREPFLDKEPRFSAEAMLTGDKEHQDISISLKKGRSHLEANWFLRNWKEYTAELNSHILIDELEIISPESFSGIVDIKGSGKGIFPDINGLVHLRSDRILLSQNSLGSINLDGILNRDRLIIAGSLFDNRMALKGMVSFSKPPTYSVILDFNERSYKSLVHSFIKELPEDSELLMHGSLKMEGTINSISGELYLDKFLIKAYDQQIHNDGPVHLVIDKNIMDIRSFRLINHGGAITASGRSEIGKWLDLKIQGGTYLWPFKRFSRSIRTIKGKADFELAISGNWQSPQITGTISLRDGTIGIEEIPYLVTDVKCLVRFRENLVNIEYLNGKVAGGSIEAKGIAYLKGFRLGRFNIEMTMKDISARLSEDFTMTFDSQLYLRGERYLGLITGDVKLKRAVYSKYIEWRSWMLKMRREIPAPEVEIPTYLNAKLNIKITGPVSPEAQAIVIDNNIARLTLRVALLLKGTLKKPVLMGRVEAIEGIVYFRNNELRLIKAVADFTDPERIDPYLRIKAETFSKGYRINMLFEGHMRRFNLTLSSEPPLDEVDIIALLAVGETGTALKGYGGGIGAAEASSFITGQLQETIEQRARLYTGIDRVQISPYVSKTGEIGPRVTVGKKIGERLSILYSSAVGSKESDVVRIEYELSNRVSIVGEKDERGSMGGDIKFRFHFR